MSGFRSTLRLVDSCGTAGGLSMTTKETVLQAIRDLPDDASLEEILDAVFLHLKIERGRSQIQAGQGLSPDQVRERLARWLG